MKSKEEVLQSIKNNVARDKKNLENARNQLTEGAKFVVLHGQDSYFDGQDITRMSIEQINSALGVVRSREENISEYVKNNLIAVANNISSGIDERYTPFTARLILEEKEYQELINGERKTADNKEELDSMIQEIFEYYGYEGNYKDKPTVKMSKFKEIYEKSRGKLKQALETFRGIFNKNKRLESTNGKDESNER